MENRISLIYRFLSRVFPKVDMELARWVREIRCFGSDELAYQAMASIRLKKFHCQGGSIFSLYPGCNTDRMIELIVALQTISDYLDNLCDRCGFQEERAFRQLHLAFIEALEPEGALSDYYLYYPFRDDGGYLSKLVGTCRECVNELPLYRNVRERIMKLGELYSELQIYKHLSPNIREHKVISWTLPNLKEYRDITSWEFAAASGSTLAIFMMFALSSSSSRLDKDIDAAFEAYFPWICGLHILLDYFIDLKEDREWGDLNFVSFYSDMSEAEDRLKLFIEKSIDRAGKLPNNYFHRVVVQGLLALYLSDPKIELGSQGAIGRRLVNKGGGTAYTLWRICRRLRSKGFI